MKKQIYLLLVVALFNLSSSVEASIGRLCSTSRAATALISQYVARPGRLPSSALNYTRQPIQQLFASPGFTTPAMRTFTTRTPEFIAKSSYRYWQQFKDSSTAKWAAGLFASGALAGGVYKATDPASAEEESELERESRLRVEQKLYFKKHLGFDIPENVREFHTNRLWQAIDKYCLSSIAAQDEIIEAIKKGADVNTRDKEGNTAYMHLLSMDLDELNILPELLHEHAVNVNRKNNNGKSVLMMAVDKHRHKNYLEVDNLIIDTLIKDGADVKASDNDGRSVLMYAVKPTIIRCRSCNHKYWKENTPDTIKKLVAAGADVNAKDKNGETALIYGCGNTDVLKELVSLGADIDVKDQQGVPVLISAIGSEYAMQKVEILIGAGVDVNATNLNDSTPLMHAAWRGKIDVVKALIAAGSDVHAKNNKGEMALDWAKEKNHTDIIELLKQQGTKE